MIHIEITRTNGEYGFEATDAGGRTMRTDDNHEGEERHFGVGPMQSLLMALGGCSGIDVVSILKKQKQELKHFRMLIDGEREQGKVPSVWKEVKVIFELSGYIDPDKAIRACQLSIEKYCSVAETLRRAGATITWEVKINN